MENKDYIRDELLEVAPAIVQIEKDNVYSVSSGYFNQLLLEILDKVRSGEEPAYYFSRSIPYKVPTDYFETLAKSILQKAQSEIQRDEVFTEMEEISPLLNTISKKTVYAVPEDYFDRLTDTSIAFKERKVIAIKTFPKVIKYAAAAIITAFMAIGMYLLINNNSSSKTGIKNNPTAGVEKLSEDEIANFLKTNFAPEDATTVNYGSSLKEGDIRKSVREMSDKEIQQFLQEEGEAEEI